MVERLFHWVEDFRRAGLARLAFGEPQRDGGRTTIPVVDVWVRRVATVDSTPSGVGAQLPGPRDGVVARPVALLTVGEGGVRLEPAESRLAASVLSGAAAGLGAALGWWLAGRRRA